MRQTRFLRDALLSNRNEISHPDPDRAVDLAIFMAAATCREWILFGDAPHARSTLPSDDELHREAARQMLGYLRTPETSAG